MATTTTAATPHFTPVREQPLPDWPTPSGGGARGGGDNTAAADHHRAELRPAAPLARALSCASCGGLLREAVVAADCCLSAFCYDCVAGAPLLMAPPPSASKGGAAAAAAAPPPPPAPPPSTTPSRPRGRPTLAAAAAAAVAISPARPQHLAKGSAAAAAVDACPACGALLGGNPWATGKLRYDPALDGLVRRAFPRPLLDAALERRRAERGARERAARAAALLGGRRGGCVGAKREEHNQQGAAAAAEQHAAAEDARQASAALALFPARGPAALPELERPYLVVPESSRVRDVVEHVRQALGGRRREQEEQAAGASAAAPADAPLALRTERDWTALDPDFTVGEAVRIARQEGEEEEEGAPPAPVVLYYYCGDRGEAARAGMAGRRRTVAAAAAARDGPS